MKSFSINRLLIAACLVVMAGCGSDKGLVPVSGTVTLNGQPMPHSGTVRFLPQKVEGDNPRRAAFGKFDTDGAYQAQSFEPGDGLYPGTYAVTVTCFEVEPSVGGPPAVSAIDNRYKNLKDSGLEIVVSSSDSSKIFDVDLE